MCNEQIISIITLLFTVVSTIVLLLISIFGPKRIMFRQNLLDLMKEYRSAEIGIAVFNLIRFYELECCSDLKKVAEKYVDRYNEEIGYKKEKNIDNLSTTLHFQRRILSQFYRQIADLRYEGSIFTRIKSKDIMFYLTSSEAKMLKLLYLIERDALPKIKMNFTMLDNMIPETETSNMTKNMKKLIKESRNWK